MKKTVPEKMRNTTDTLFVTHQVGDHLVTTVYLFKVNFQIVDLNMLIAKLDKKLSKLSRKSGKNLNIWNA